MHNAFNCLHNNNYHSASVFRRARLVCCDAELNKTCRAEAVRTYTDTELPIPVTKPKKCASLEEKEKQAKQLDELAEKLRVTLAKHPALSADSAFAALPASEEKLKNAICTYNAGADRLSGKLTRFPSKTVAGRMCLENRQRFSL